MIPLPAVPPESIQPWKDRGMKWMSDGPQAVEPDRRLDRYRRAIAVIELEDDPVGYYATFVEMAGTRHRRWRWFSTPTVWKENIHWFRSFTGVEDDDFWIDPDEPYDSEDFADLEASQFRYPDIRIDTDDLDEPNILYQLHWLDGEAAEDAWRSAPFEHMQANGIGT